MCEFCVRHGEGKKWYLNAANYSEDLLSDLRRRRYIESFFVSPEHLRKGDRALRLLNVLPSILWKGLRQRITERQKITHFGQVIPIEDVERIFAFTTSITRLSCICRHVTLGKEHRHCYAVSVIPERDGALDILREIGTSYLIGPQTQGLEAMTPETALAHMREDEREGLCHTVWTFRTPFIAGICNCSLPGCLAMKTTLTHKTPVFFRSEYLARIDNENCAGCGACAKVCPFDAILVGAKREPVSIDIGKCSGCGVCRSVCVREAVSLIDRQSVPGALYL